MGYSRDLSAVIDEIRVSVGYPKVPLLNLTPKKGSGQSRKQENEPAVTQPAAQDSEQAGPSVEVVEVAEEQSPAKEEVGRGEEEDMDPVRRMLIYEGGGAMLG